MTDKYCSNCANKVVKTTGHISETSMGCGYDYDGYTCNRCFHFTMITKSYPAVIPEHWYKS